MAVMDLESLYQQHIQPLPPVERLRLLALVAQGLADSGEADAPALSLLDLDGLGADVWAGIDPQDYVDRLRGEWRDLT